MRSIDAVADHLQGEIAFDARADVRRALVKKRPASVWGLNAAQIRGDHSLECGIYRFSQVVPHQHVLGRYRGVGLELEHEMAVRVLQTHECSGSRANRRLELPDRNSGRSGFLGWP